MELEDKGLPEDIRNRALSFLKRYLYTVDNTCILQIIIIPGYWATLKSTSNEKMDFAFYCYLDTWVHLKLCNALFLAKSHERRRKKTFFLCPPRCDFWKIHVLFTSYVIEEKAETRMRSAPSTYIMQRVCIVCLGVYNAYRGYWGHYACVSPLSPQWHMM